MWYRAPDDRLCGYIRYTPAMTRGPSCARLCRLLGMDREDFLIWNLLHPDNKPGTWHADKARDCARPVADHLCDRYPEQDRVLLLGERVVAAFNYSGARFGDPVTIHNPSGRSHKVSAMVVPHPSGRSRFWNDPDAEGEIRSRIQGFISEEVAA